MTQLSVKEIWQDSPDHFQILWSDDKNQRFDVRHLRKNCPCATCVDELSGQRKPQTLTAAATTPVSVTSVGRYALAIHYQDGHNTGIYTFEHLRTMGESV